MIGIYLAIGFGCWLSLAVVRRDTMRQATVQSKLLGFFGAIIAWPIMLYFADKE